MQTTVITLIGHTNAVEDVPLVPVEEPSDVSSSSDLPPRYVAAVRKMIDTLMANPTEDTYNLVLDEVVYIRPMMEDLLKNFSEDRKAEFVEDLLQDVTKAFMKRSRVPLKHRLSNAAIRVIVKYLGKMPQKKVLSEDVIERLQRFADQLQSVCRQDAKCKRFL